MQTKRIVVKVGSSSLTNEQGQMDRAKIAALVEKLTALHRAGHELILVSSGAVAAGVGKLGWDRANMSLPEKQAAAAVGQGLLLDVYERLFAEVKIVVAQILLTRLDIEDEQRFENIRNTLETLLQNGVLPIINENDTVAVEEICFGDNDRLGGLVALASEAELLVLLTDIDGFYDADPHRDPNARRIADVWEISGEMEQMAGGSGSAVGTGGMRSKLAAAKIGMEAGFDVVVASSQQEDVLLRIVQGESIGTRFHARTVKKAKEGMEHVEHAK